MTIMAETPDLVDDTEHRPWSRLRQDIGAVLWSAFLAACLATMLFFAMFDPILLAHDGAPPKWLADRKTGYAVGFFFFWAMTTVSALLTAWLIDTRSFQKQARSKDPA
jgi:hypothetical protein